MKNILVPTDFSENADHALNHAIELSKKTNGEIHILHTYTTTSHAGHLANIDRIVREDREKEMVAYLAKRDNASIEGRVRNGGAVDMIADEAKKKNSDLIVMGTLGANKLSKKVLGSTASNVIKHSNIPVLAIPFSVKQTNFDRLIVALDALNTPATQVLDAMVDFAKTLDLRINLVHVSNDVVHTDLDPEIKKHLNENNIHYTHSRIESEDALHGILDYASGEENAILCLVSRHRNWFENLFHNSVSEQIAMQATMPLLVLHDSDS